MKKDQLEVCITSKTRPNPFHGVMRAIFHLWHDTEVSYAVRVVSCSKLGELCSSPENITPRFEGQHFKMIG